MESDNHVRASDNLLIEILGELKVSNANYSNLAELVKTHERTLHGESGSNGVCGTQKTHAEKIEQLEKVNARKFQWWDAIMAGAVVFLGLIEFIKK